MRSKMKAGRKKRKNKSVLKKKVVAKDKNEAIYISDEDSVCEVVVNNETEKQNGGTNAFNESFLSGIAEMIYKEAKKSSREDNKKDDAVTKIIEESTNNKTINSNEEVDINDDEIVISSDEDDVEERLNARYVYLAPPTVVLSCDEHELIENRQTWDNIPKVKNKKGKEQENKTQKVNESDNSHFYDCDFEDLLDNLKNENKKGLQEQKTTTGAENSKRPRINASNDISQKSTDLSKDKIGSVGQVQDQILRKLLTGESTQAQGPTSSASVPLIINQGLPTVTLQGVPLPITYGTNVIFVQVVQPNIHNV